MNREIAFRTKLFESVKTQPHFINERCFGEDLGLWLIDKLRESGFSFTEPFQEDWGWQVEAKKEDEIFLIQIGIMDESVGEENAEWLISVEKPKPWFSFKTENSVNFHELCRKIFEVLESEPEIFDLNWTE